LEKFPGSGLADDLYGVVHEFVLPHVEAPEGHLRRDTLGQAPESTPQKVIILPLCSIRLQFSRCICIYCMVNVNNIASVQCHTLAVTLYTVKIFCRIPVFFFTKPFRNGKTPMLTRDFLVPSREGIFCLLRREKYSSLCRGNFFLSVECYISLFPLFSY
jgi:hypothetical protein